MEYFFFSFRLALVLFLLLVSGFHSFRQGGKNCPTIPNRFYVYVCVCVWCWGSNCNRKIIDLPRSKLKWLMNNPYAEDKCTRYRFSWPRAFAMSSCKWEGLGERSGSNSSPSPYDLAKGLKTTRAWVSWGCSHSEIPRITDTSVKSPL